MTFASDDADGRDLGAQIEYHHAMCRGGVVVAMGIGLIACAGGNSSANHPGAASIEGVAASPSPAGLPQEVPAGGLHWISGDRAIVPDDATKNAITESCVHELHGSFRVCITTQGAVASVCLIKTTGYSAYDRTIVQAIWSQWHYRPFIMNGVPTPACTTVNFVYTQHVEIPARCDQAQ